jgi:hypothetical protein
MADVKNVKNIKNLIKTTQEQAGAKGLLKSGIKSIASGIGGTSFPQDLDPKRAVAIHVYDTSKAEQVYNGLINSTQNIASNFTGWFSDGANAGLSALTDSAVSKFTSGISEITGGLFGGKTSIKDVVGGFIGQMPNIEVGVANGKLGCNYYETFYLPIPNALSESMSNEYEGKDGWFNDIPALGGALKGTVDTLTKPTATWSKLTGARNLQYYENKIQMYNSTEFREIELSWTLSPNSAAESKILHDIVKKIKMYGSPESAAGKIILKSPCFFGVEFNNTTLNEALRFDEVVLTSASIEYVPGGNMEMYKDNMPKSISLSLSFRDREPKLREDWENGRKCKQENEPSCESSSTTPSTSTKK